MKVKLLTKWKDEQLVCCCPIVNKCNKEHGCEELDFILDSYSDVKECMNHDAYKKVNGRVHQRR